MKVHRFITYILFFQVFYYGCKPTEPKLDKPVVAADEKKPVDVFVVKAKKQQLYTPLLFAGLLKAKDEVKVYTQLAGTVSRIHVQEGAKISKGQTLVSVKPHGMGLAYQEHLIKAPQAGILVRLAVDLGQHVDTHQELGLVGNHAEFETNVHATESDLAYVRKGNKVKLTLSPSTPLESTSSGEVMQVAVSPDPETLAYKIKVKVLCQRSEPCSRGLRIGALVRVEAKQNQRLGYLVPSKYLHKRATQVILAQEGKAAWVDIKTGEVFGDQTELLAGVDDTSVIISSYATRPKNGDTVNIVQNEGEQKPLSTAPDQKNTHL